MVTDKRIPVVIGVTGHRNCRPEDREALYEAVKGELQKLGQLCPHSKLLMLSSLAEGGDLLCADAAEELGIAVIAALPREKADYEQDFSEEGKERFPRHCERAEQVFVAPSTEEPSENGSERAWQFRQAGIYVASHAHVLLALWDGHPGKNTACGTADAVDFALKGQYSPGTGTSVRSERNEGVIHIVTPRGEVQEEEAAGTVHYLGDWDCLRDILKKTDDFNRNAADLSVQGERKEAFLFQRDEGDPSEADRILLQMDEASRAAGKLSRKFAGYYRRILGLLAAAGALLTFAFLLYDEAQAIWMILVCGVMLLGAWACSLYAGRSDCHRRYIEYRALAECLRVQTYLRYAGTGLQAAQLLTWTQQEETAWILCALSAFSIGPDPGTKHDIRVPWVLGQRDYHHNALKSSGTKLAASSRTVTIAASVSALLYVSAVGFELLCGGILAKPVFPVADAELWRTILKIFLGTISVVTLFISSYYGRLSLSRILSDHRKMEHFYSTMAEKLENQGQTEELLTALAREELIENGNWCSYQRDNAPEISL